MLKLIGWTVALTTIAANAVPVAAGDKLVPEEGAIEMMMLLQPDVCEELKLTADERAKIKDFATAQWEKAKRISKLDEETRAREFTAMTKQNDRFVDDTLTKDQDQRLTEILLQFAGPLLVTRPEIAKQLELSDEQIEKASQLQKQARDDMEELIYSTKEEEKHQRYRELHEISRKDLHSLLTDKQKAKWKEMLGKPFKGKMRHAKLP